MNVIKVIVYEILTHLPQSYPIKKRKITGDNKIKKTNFTLKLIFLFEKELVLIKQNNGKKPIITIMKYLNKFSRL